MLKVTLHSQTKEGRIVNSSQSLQLGRKPLQLEPARVDAEFTGLMWSIQWGPQLGQALVAGMNCSYNDKPTLAQL